MNHERGGLGGERERERERERVAWWFQSSPLQQFNVCPCKVGALRIDILPYTTSLCPCKLVSLRIGMSVA